jgi:dUTP pyrophosphatase
MKMPHGVYGRIAPRSGLAWKKHIDCGAGVIDVIPFALSSFLPACLPFLISSFLPFHPFLPFRPSVLPFFHQADYRGDIGVILFNHGKEALEVKLHDRVAQLILERHMVGEEVKEVDNLDETERGAGGYGSTGFGRTIEKKE